MDERRDRWMDQATRVLVVLIVAAVLLNGLPFWSRRVGLLDHQAYAQDLERFCHPHLHPLWLPASCRPHRLSDRGVPIRMDGRRLYRSGSKEQLMKGARVPIVLLLLVGSAVLLIAGWQPIPPLLKLLPLVPLALSTVVSAWISVPEDGLAITALSAIWALWIPLSALAGWLTSQRRLQVLADGAAALVVLQIPFLVVEAMRGVPMPFGGPASPWLPTRLTGLMNQPNTLGGLLAISVALCMAVSHRRWQRWPLLLLSLTLAGLARSGTGVVALALLAVWRVMAHLPRRWRVFPVVAMVLLVVALPQLLGRPQLFDSPSGRVRILRVWINNPRTARERWLGYGLAAPSDSIRQAPTLPGTRLPERKRRGPSADGLPLFLLSQGGVVALLAFYGLLGWCFWRDLAMRSVWFVLLISSLTLNITQVFPVGIWLAVLTARGLGPTAPLRPAKPRG